MDHQELRREVEAEARATYERAVVRKAAPAAADRFYVTLDLEEVATVIEETIERRVAPLYERIAQLEAELQKVMKLRAVA